MQTHSDLSHCCTALHFEVGCTLLVYVYYTPVPLYMLTVYQHVCMVRTYVRLVYSRCDSIRCL